MLYVNGETLYMPDTLIQGDPQEQKPAVSPVLVGAVVLAVLILYSRKKTRKNPIPLFLLPGV